MKWVTPKDIAAVVFTSRRARRGYDETEVDNFLDAVSESLRDMLDYIGELEAERRELRDEIKLWESESRPGLARQVRPEGGAHDGMGAGRDADFSRPPSPGPYADLSPEVLEEAHARFGPSLLPPMNVPRPGRDSSPLGSNGHHAGSSPGAATGTGPGHPFPSLADEIAEGAEAYLADEARRRAARLDPDPRVWRSLVEADRARWALEAGVDVEPIDWTIA